MRLELERSLWKENYHRVMGLDEVGRGCLSGPVVAAGVILPPGIDHTDYQDSKKLAKEKRILLAGKIREEALFWTIRSCWPEEIDRINILQASIRAMLLCVEAGGEPDYLLVDGNRFTEASPVPYRCVVGGDDRSASIAAASILAKVHRDHLMALLHNEYPWYGWDTNVGYPTRQHYEGLRKYGPSRYHRRSFRLAPLTEEAEEDLFRD